ncbi:caspase family protein [Pelagibacterales bacterium SAG-MED29]|nr:caspase family protein [Pelagibacterales bacterium SAG-MED29]
MFKLAKKISILFFVGIFLISSAEANWITKKSDKSKETIKKEKKEKSEWIKLKKLKDKVKLKKKKKEVKENKEEYKKEEKKITNTVKSWITKKTKTKYISSINDLPKGAIYFSGSNEVKNLFFYGYVFPDENSKLIDGFYETSKGVGFFNDGKTTCQIGSTVLIVDQGELTSRVFGKCSNGLKFAGKTSQTKNSGWGQAKTSDGKERLNFDFNVNKTEIAKLYNKNKEVEESIVRSLPSTPKKRITLNPKGKYYALLIGNSNYNDNGWDDLVSPINDITAIKAVLDKSYKFEKIMMVRDGTKREIFKAFQDLSKLTTTNDFVLIYYSGHGMVKAEQAYWIPKDGSLEWGNGDWININELNIFLTEIKAHHLALMVDSCYVGGKFKGVNILDMENNEDRKILNTKLQDYLDLRSRSVLSSGSLGQVSDTAPNSKNSIFALSFINMLNIFEKESNPLNMRSVAFNLENAFAGNYNQKPYYYHPDTWKHLGGDFIFIPKNNLK